MNELKVMRKKKENWFSLTSTGWMSSLPFPSAMAASGADCNGSGWVFWPDTVAGSSSILSSVEKKLKDSNQLNMIWNII